MRESTGVGNWRRLAGAGCVAIVLVMVSGLAAACGSSPSTATGARGGSSQGTTNTTQGTTGSSPSSTGNGIVAKAKAALAAATGPTTHWSGPTTGPKGVSGKTIGCLEYDASDPVAQNWCNGVKEAAEALKWGYKVFPADGTVASQTKEIDAAIALNVNGLVISADAASNAGALSKAAAAGIKVVGINSAALQKPYPKLDVYMNLTDDGAGQARLAADMAIAESNGKAHAISVTDVTFAIAKLKADAFRSEIEKCSTCKFLLYDNVPAGELTQRMPSEVSSYLTKFSGPIYVYAVNDNFFDPAIATLSAGNVPKSGRIMLIGSGGSASAYARIRSGSWEIGTIPLPLREQGWQAVDELNRAFSGTAPEDWVPALHVVTKANIASSIVAGGYFDPANHYAEHFKKIWGVG